MLGVLSNQHFGGRVDQVALQLVGSAAHLKPVLAEDRIVEVLLLLKVLLLAEGHDVLLLEFSLRENCNGLAIGGVALHPAEQVDSLVLRVIVQHFLEHKLLEINLFCVFAHRLPILGRLVLSDLLNFMLANFDFFVQEAFFVVELIS